MSDRPVELSTADFAGQQTRDPQGPVDGHDDHLSGKDERLLRDDEGLELDGDGPGRDRAGEDTGVHDHGTETGDRGQRVGAGDAGAGIATASLLDSHDAEGFRARWTDVQTEFVDAPRESVERADALVAELMQHLAKTFADERSGLERHWDRGDDIATDDLRTAFQRYRSFFERLLAT